MHRFIRDLVLLIAVLGLVGCSANPFSPNRATPAQQDVRSNQQRATPPETPPADLGELVQGNSALAFDLYHRLRAEQDNLFYSPYSISLALAMTYAGARGETAEQMAQTLHFSLDPDRLHPAFNALDALLASRGQDAQGKDGQGFRLHIANALWGQQGYAFRPAFLDLLAEHYGAGLTLLDFRQPEQARQTINQWVAEQTEDRIQDLLPAGSLNSLTRLVLTNAIYFNAAWEFPFEVEDTTDGAFHLLDGSEITVPMMRQGEYLYYAQGEDYQAVELPYDGGELSMVILLPQPGRFAAFEESLDAARVQGILDEMEQHLVALTMPRFTIESGMSLADTLSALGMTTAFKGDADFSGMTDTSELLYIGDVIHKAFVTVDEAGTEAAAATAVVMAGGAPQPQEMTIDRPFVFVIRDIQTGTLLFVGRVLNPVQ
ncbi:MAG: serpin family protein [Chloroflexi bacterium]|nr:serpin family protein [Chloroflexota bacterium]